MNNESMSGDPWPEQDAVDSWCDKHGISADFKQRMELKEAVTAYRLKLQDEIARLRAPAALPEGWIDLNERMPEPEVYVLTWDGKKVGVDWWGALRHRGDGVTHWMPFMAPPGAGPMYGMHAAPAPSGVSAPAAVVPATDTELIARLRYTTPLLEEGNAQPGELPQTERERILALAKQHGLWCQKAGVWMAWGGESELIEFTRAASAATKGGE